MNIKTFIYLCLICSVCFSCTQPNTNKEESSKDLEIAIESPYPPEETAIVTLKLESETLPGTPRVVSANDTQSAFFENVGVPEEIKQLTENIWIAVVKTGQSYVIGWIVEDNKMFGYCSEPFVAKNGLDVSFSPGMPSTIEYDLSNPEEGVEIFPALFLVSRKATKDGENTMIDFGIAEVIEEPRIVKVEGFAQGDFQIWAQSLKAQNYLEERVRFLSDKRLIKVEPGQNTRTEAVYPIFDDTVEEGDVTIKGIAYNSVGETLSNEKIRLIPIDGTAPRVDLYYPNSTTDSQGYFEFKGVSPDIDLLIKAVGGSIKVPGTYLAKDSSLWVDFLLGKLNLKLFAEYSTPEFIVYWQGDQSRSILELFGKYVVIQAWSSSYAPSIESLSELNSLAKEYKDNDDILFVAMGTDCDRNKWEEAVNKTNFDELRHCWYDYDKNSLALNKLVPYFMVLDKKAILCAEGSNIDFRAELEKAIEAFREE